MAAISALMINESTSQQDKGNDSQTPTGPKPVVRIRSPEASDIAMIPYSEPRPSANLHQDDTQTSNPGTHQDVVASQNADHKHSNSSSMDIDETAAADDDDDDDDDIGSDDEADHGEGSAARKKKGQRFFCTGYLPCSLSFTRSEHLARHIRKHTGERPFQCHCNRRFSRLDNLRQHAQTVHVNEEIPTDSLAATGTRYQRQIRTDRVRPAPRPRTGTMSSTGSHGRGHGRNLSTSSITSTSSVYSNATDIRRRPPPLLMAGDNRPTTPPTYSSYAAHSPGDMSTPTSATLPATPGSPNFASNLGSPMSTASRMSTFLASSRTLGRRLSVPSSVNPYQPPYNIQYGSGYGPGPAIPTTGVSSIVTSPTPSNFSTGPNVPDPSAEDWRRRTWHPSTYSSLNINYRPATSGLTYSQTPDAPQPAYAPNAVSAASQAPRLPGIESFDHVQHRPTTPPRRNPTPTQSMMNPPPPLLAAPRIESRRKGHAAHASWDGTKRSHYHDIDDHGRPATAWAPDTLQQFDLLRDSRLGRGAPHPPPLPPPPVMGPPPYIVSSHHPQQLAKEALDLQSSAPKRVKRSGNYNGPGSAYRTSPDSSSSDGVPTPGTSAAELHPTIISSNGYLEPQLLAGEAQNTPCLAPPIPVPQPHGRYIPDHKQQYPATHSRSSSELNRLEALVAVATSENPTR